MPGAPVALLEVLQAHKDTIHEDIHTSMPATVVSYDAPTRTCSVQPSVRMPTFDAAGNITDHQELPIISDVPVAMYRGGGFFFAWPLKAGDGVMLQFSESAMGQWRTTGQTSDPVDVARHSLGYPVAYPVISPDTMPFHDAASDGMYIGAENDPAQIKFVPGTISLSPGATDFVALASLVKANFDAIKSAFHDTVTDLAAAAAAPAAAYTPTMVPPTLGDVAAAHVKAL